MATNAKTPATATTRKRTPSELHHRAAAHHTAAAHHHLEAAHHHDLNELEPARKHSVAANGTAGKLTSTRPTAHEQTNK